MDDWLYNDLPGIIRAMYSESHFRFTPHSSKQIIKTLDILSIDICDNIIPFDAGSETQKVKSALQLLHLVRQYQVTRIIIAQNMFFCADCRHQQNDDENKEKRPVHEIKFIVIHVNMFQPLPELCLA